MRLTRLQSSELMHKLTSRHQYVYVKTRFIDIVLRMYVSENLYVDDNYSKF